MKAFKWMGKEQNSVRRISWLLIIMFIFSLITLRIIIARADNSNKKLNVLEIQPVNSFTLKGINNLIQTGIDTKTITRSSTLETYDVTIEHVSMPEFIGKIDQLNGKYDVIVIGRNNANIAAPYRDYSAINNNGTEYTGSIRTSDNSLLPNGNYAENDITKRKAEEIKAFVNSGQLVYINNSILTDVSKLQNSNLYKTFNPITARNLIKYNYVNNNEELSLENILEKYLEKDSSSQNDIINKRPIITVENTSGGDVQTDYSNTTQADYLGSSKNRNMKFLINIPQDADKFTVKLFLDINGDGVFTDDECYRKATNVSSQSAYSLSYNIGPQFIGWLDWKVEAEKPNGVKSYVIGNVFFKKLKEEDIKQVKVLQVSPSSGLDLQHDTTFKSMLKSFNDKKDYNLNITKITSDDFSNKAGKSLKLNGTYDMVIIGFSDSYNKKDITGDALNELQDFVKSGQSVMFTHDTMTLRMESSGQASVELTKRFRDFVGQSRFIDKYRTDGKQTDAYQQYNPETKTYVERIIPHSDLINQNGSILTTNSSIVGYALNGRKNITHTTKVYKTNSGLISNYPFKLGDISVAQTHNQWYQLDLEDPDIVPWYNLKYDGTTRSDYYNEAPSGSKLNQYDSRNNYYTYSKGNITYSGTGHSQGYTTEEFQLFINTMIKAERGANHKPDVVCSILNEYKEDDGHAVNEVPKGADYTFKVDANDLDKDKVYVDIKINGRALDSSNVTMSNLNNNGLFEVNTQNINRSPLTVTIPAQNLSTLGNDVTVVIKATDIQGAESETKTYKIRPVEMPKFDINAGIPTLKKINSSGSMTQVSGTIATVKPGDEVLVSYNVTPSELKYGDTKAVGSKEISVIIDNSLTQSTWAQFKNGLDDTLGELLETGYMRYNVITFGKDGASVYKEGSSVEDLKNNLTRGNLGNDIGKTDLDGKKISSALDLSVEFFYDSEFQTDSASKTIMIFSKGNVEAINEQVKSLIKDNYNVITVQISDNNNSESPNLKNVHNALGALNSDYYVCNSGHTGRESHDSADVIMEEISNSISRIEYQTYMLDNVEVNFNLGDEIDLVDGLTQVDINANEYKKTLPKIKYVVDVDDNGNIRTDNGKPIYKGYFIDTEQQDLTYTESYPVNFKITSAEGAYGLCTFSTPNEVTYRYFGTNLPGSTDISSTPQLQLDEVAVSHGVYKGVKNGQVEYLSGSNVNFVDDSVGTFAAQINNLYKDNTTLSLKIDTNCEIVGIPTIYRITEGNNLVKLTDSSDEALVFTSLGGNNYVFNNFNGSVNNDIVVLYSVKFKGFDESSNEPKKEYMYTNKITADGYSADAKVPRKTDGKLPDLF